MNATILETLGFSKEELLDKIVAQAVDGLLAESRIDDDGDEVALKSNLAKRIQEETRKKANEAFERLAQAKIEPYIAAAILDLQVAQTNRYGEKKGEPVSFTEYLCHRAEAYLGEKVNSDGKTREESGSSYWDGKTTRCEWLVRKFVTESYEKMAKEFVIDANRVLIESINKSIKEQMINAVNEIKFGIK